MERRNGEHPPHFLAPCPPRGDRAPYLWMLAFFLVPFGFVLKISLSQTAIAQPPYVPQFDLAQGWGGYEGCARGAVAG